MPQAHHFGWNPETGRSEMTTTTAPYWPTALCHVTMLADFDVIRNWYEHQLAYCKSKMNESAQRSDFASQSFYSKKHRSAENKLYYFEQHHAFYLAEYDKAMLLEPELRGKYLLRLYAHENMVRRVLSVKRVLIVPKHAALWAKSRSQAPKLPSKSDTTHFDFEAEEWWAELNTKPDDSGRYAPELLKMTVSSRQAQPRQAGQHKQPKQPRQRKQSKQPKQPTTQLSKKKYWTSDDAAKSKPCLFCKGKTHALISCSKWLTTTEEGQSRLAELRAARGGLSQKQYRTQRSAQRTVEALPEDPDDQ